RTRSSSAPSPARWPCPRRRSVAPEPLSLFTYSNAMRRNPDTILALDPGLKDLGYAVLRGRRIVTSGVLGLRRVPKDDRLAIARKNVRAWITTHRSAVVVVEKTYRPPLPWLNQLHQISTSARTLAHRQKVR